MSMNMSDETEDEIKSFTVVTDEGETVECYVLFTFKSEETGKFYIVYTDNTLDEENNAKVYANIYNPEEVETRLLPIETDREWLVIETLLDELQKEAADGDGEFDADAITETLEQPLTSSDDESDE